MRTTAVAIALILAVALVAVGSVLAASDDATASEWCGLCHRDIYKMWRASAHSRSVESIPFLLSYRETEELRGQQAADTCLGCHAPMRAAVRDSGLTHKVTWEGVNCDACHSIVDVRMTGDTPVNVLDVGHTKRGPIREAVSSGHDVEFSELHTSSLVCAGCHEFNNEEGTAILSTYSEWLASEHGQRGETCQTCHMSTTDARVVDPRVQRTNDPVNIHEVPGGHSRQMLNDALTVDFDAERNADGLDLLIRLINNGAGHSVPTGMPGRRIVLDIQVSTSSGQKFSEQRIYGRFFEDAEGDPITKDSGYFVGGIKEIRDTRFASGESRLEKLALPVEPGDTAYVTLKLRYEHSPMGNEDGRTRLTFYVEKKTIKADRAS